MSDPQGRSYRKRQNLPACLGYLSHVLSENHNGLVVNTRVPQATGTVKRQAATAMVEARARHQRLPVGFDAERIERTYILHRPAAETLNEKPFSSAS
jgi:hypothetical protein